MKEALQKLLHRILDKKAKDSVWIEHDWCGDTESGFYSEWEVDMDKLDSAIDEFCEEFEAKQVAPAALQR